MENLMSNKKDELMQFDNGIDFYINLNNNVRIADRYEFAKSEVERTRRFDFPNRAQAGKVGFIDNMKLHVRYDRNICDVTIEYIEHVGPFYITTGTTRVGLLDISNNIITEWDHGLFRQCGVHHRSMAAKSSRDVAERVTGLSFRTVGSVNGAKC
jgi:hypothetical protein